ncbi:type VII secretion EssA family protein [Intestinibacter bartlettii]|uniref:type VII secretion EssA family protein n=1 Tax=Intestinibacter bartlettii TaxID=261299 RepID=UPI003AB16FBB
MKNKIKILGLSAFIATGMVPLGATQIFANEINPTQVEERNLDIEEDYDIDDNLEDVDENEEIDDSEIIPINDYVEDYQSDNNQEQKDNQEDINENKDRDSNEEQDSEDNNEDELLIGQPKSNDTPKTSDAGVGGYIGVIIASIGGLFAVIRKMI